MHKEEIEKIIKDLIEEGENAEELQFWLEKYPELPPELQLQVYANLKKELEELRNLHHRE